MDNKERFLIYCKMLAYAEQADTILQDIGLSIDPGRSPDKPKTFSDFFEGICCMAMDLVQSCLNEEDECESEYLANDIMFAGIDKYLEVAEEIWEEYGVK